LPSVVISGKSGIVPNIPPGVPPMLGTHQYIMSQGGLPYFQQPVYSYEDLQLLQQRIPHVVMPSHIVMFVTFDMVVMSASFFWVVAWFGLLTTY
jgi:hypothetical protein